MIFTSANPPHMLEFLVATQAMAEFLLDHVLYVVNCAPCGPPALAETTEHRLAMAQVAAAIFGSLIIFTDLDARKDLVLEPTRMANGRERLRAEGEDYAFRVFRFNSEDRLTLVFIASMEHCRKTDGTGRDDTINKLLLNIKQRYCEFNPDLHNVIALFVGDQSQMPADLAFDSDEQSLFDRGLFAIESMSRPPLGSIQCGEKAIARGLREALLNGRLDYLTLLPKPVLSYLQAHKDCKQRLIESLTD